MVILASKGPLFSILTIRLMLGRKALAFVEVYDGEEVNGRMSECVVDGKESSKVVEGCRLEDVLSSIISFVCASPRYFARLWQLSEYDADISGS